MIAELPVKENVINAMNVVKLQLIHGTGNENEHSNAIFVTHGKERR